MEEKTFTKAELLGTLKALLTRNESRRTYTDWEEALRIGEVNALEEVIELVENDLKEKKG